MADRAEYARKGIARGRSLVVLQYADGIVFVGENPSRALHKFSEIYDRIGFAAAGKYNEYENLRIGGVRYADLRGYTYDRDDVTARGLANVYAQTLGTIFSSQAEKPYEVELVVAEVGESPDSDQIYRLPHDGSIVDEHGSVAVGGNAEQISGYLDQRHRDGMTLAEALKLAVQALSRDTNGSEREIPGGAAGGRGAGPDASAEAQVQAHRGRPAVAAAGGRCGCGVGGRRGGDRGRERLRVGRGVGAHLTLASPRRGRRPPYHQAHRQVPFLGGPAFQYRQQCAHAPFAEGPPRRGGRW
ncbi:Proteasome subunit alpha [Streptomyces tendae]